MMENNSELLLKSTRKAGRTDWYFQEGLFFDDDIFLCSYPRSGNHFSRFILLCIRHYMKNKKFPEDYENILDIPGVHNCKERIEKCPELRPRIIKTHFPFDNRYKNIIRVVRDPRDVLLSYYHYTRDRPDLFFEKPKPKMSFFNFIELELNNSVWPCSLIEYERSYRILDDKVNIVFIKYESLILNPEQEILKLLNFLKIPPEEVDLPGLIEKTKFSSMSRMFSQMKSKDIDRLRVSKMVRKGQIGSFKEEIKDSKVISFVERSYSEIIENYGYS